MKKFITMLLALSMMLGFTFVISMSALEVEENSAIEITNETLTPTAPEESEELQPSSYFNCGKDEFSNRYWRTLDDALKYYGANRSDVRQCWLNYNGHYYNYYIQMGNFRIYFYVEGGPQI